MTIVTRRVASLRRGNTASAQFFRPICAGEWQIAAARDNKVDCRGPHPISLPGGGPAIVIIQSDMGRRKALLLPRVKDRDPDNLFYCTLRDCESKKIAARRVLCGVYFPDSHRGTVDAFFFPTEKQSGAFYFPALSVRGKSMGNQYLVKLDEVWQTGFTTGTLDDVSFISTCGGPASTAEIVHLFGKAKGKFVKRGVFWLTECPLINTAMIITSSYTGAVRPKQVVKPRFTLRSGARLAFRKHFVRDRERNGERIGQLVAEFRTTRAVRTIHFKTLVDGLDDMLLLASFAARQRCVCTGWSYQDENDTLTRFYRRNLALPPDKKIDVQSCLIPMRTFPKFIRVAYRRFLSSSNQELIRNAIYNVTNESGTLESSFLRAFTGLESVLLQVARANGRPGRARHLEDAFSFFQNIHSVNLTDLWPLLDSSLGTSLAQIRNRLMHGEYLSERSIRALVYAEMNLRWVVERMLLSLLGWPVVGTHVAPSFLSHITMYRWPAMRAMI